MFYGFLYGKNLKKNSGNSRESDNKKKDNLHFGYACCL